MEQRVLQSTETLISTLSSVLSNLNFSDNHHIDRQDIGLIVTQLLFSIHLMMKSTERG